MRDPCECHHLHMEAHHVKQTWDDLSFFLEPIYKYPFLPIFVAFQALFLVNFHASEILFLALIRYLYNPFYFLHLLSVAFNSYGIFYTLFYHSVRMRVIFFHKRKYKKPSHPKKGREGFFPAVPPL